MSLFDFILGMTKSSQNTGRKNTLRDLATTLNQSDYKTNRGTKYSANPGRGTAKVLSSAYKHALKTDPKAAEQIAKNFVGKNGKPAWDK